LVIAPEPKVVARPATEGACQVRAQLSMLLVPITARMNFWAAYAFSLPSRAEATAEIESGP
jgi:hypothetical protein